MVELHLLPEQQQLPRMLCRCCCWLVWMASEIPQKTVANTNHQGKQESKMQAACCTNARFEAQITQPPSASMCHLNFGENIR